MEPCCLCARPRVLVTSQPITELLRRLKKCEQERRRVEAKLQKKYKKIQQRELYKFEVERLRIRCEEVLKPNYKKLTVQLFDDRDAKKKEMDRRAKGLESTGSHQRKTERMRKYVTGVKNQFKLERQQTTTSQLIDMRLDEAETMLSVTIDEFHTPSLEGMMSSTMHALMGHLTYGGRGGGGGGGSNEEGEREYEYHYKLVRSQQYLACMNAIRGPRALAPLPAQIPLKVSFKMKLLNMYAGVRLNVEQSQVQPSDYINQIVDQVQTHLPNTNALLWVEEDDLIDDQWEELNIHDAAEAVQARSSYLSSFLTGWTKGAWTTTTDSSPP